MYVCICKGITEGQIQQALNEGADLQDLRRELGVATDCGMCGQTCKEMVRKQMSYNFYEVKCA